MKKIYLAIPYSINPELSFDVSCKIAGKLISQGNIVFSPITHSHPIYMKNKDLLPSDSEFWLNQDLPFMGICDELHIICLKGWGTSIGIQKEIKHAKKLNKIIKFINV